MNLQTTTIPLRDLLERFNSGEILLPQFQRDYVWKPTKVRNLLDSLLNDLPVGGFYLWKPNARKVDAKSKAFGTQKMNAPAAAYLIDGQQRLTSLEAAFALFSGEDKRGEELRCYVELSATASDRGRDTRLFVSYSGRKSIAHRVSNGDPTLVEVKTFLSGEVDHDLRDKTKKNLKVLRGWTSKRVELAMQRYDAAHKMLDQPVPCTTVSNVNDEEAVEIFRRLNKGGNALREGDVRAAELARGKAVSVLKKMREFVLEERPQRLGFGFSFSFRALVVFHQGSAQFKALKPEWVNGLGPHNRTLSDSWQVTREALDRALKFADEKMKWSQRALIPSSNAIIVLAVALDKGGSSGLSSEDVLMYRRWLSLTALRGTFQGSVETTLNRFVRAARVSKGRPATNLVKSLKPRERGRLQAEELTKTGQVWGAATQVMYSWLARQRAMDWLSGANLESLVKTNRKLPAGDLTVHHIFPRSVAGKMLPNPSEANCAANFALISRETNSEFGDKLPEDVLSYLAPKQRQRAAVQFFGSDAGDTLKPERYSEFWKWRADRLADALNSDLGL